MAYNHGREERKWRIWKEAEERILRKCGVDEDTIEKIRIYDRADFNATRRFYRYLNDVGEYLEGMADIERQTEVHSVSDLLDEIENENLYRALLAVDKRTLQIVLLKMQGYSTKEIAPVPLSAFAGEPSQNVGKSFIKSYAAVCLEGAIIVLACIVFSLFASAPPVVDPNAAAVSMVWSYIGELVFNMLVLVGAVKMADRVVREMMGL